MRRSALVVAALVASTLTALPAGAAERSPGATVVVRFEPGTSPAARAAALAGAGLALVEDGGGDHVLARRVRGSSKRATGGPIESVAAPVRMAVHATAPNDPGFARQWQMPLIGVPDVWDLTTGRGAIVAVLDTGLAAGAPDLAATDVVAGFDFVDDDADPADPHGHGTHVAGTIAQSTGNGIGVAGVAPGAAVMPVRVLGADGGGTDWDVAQGLRWAADNGADVANLSFGADFSSEVLADAIGYAVDKGVTIVASSGNDGATTVSYPAADPRVIAVGSVRLDRARARYSNGGAALDLVAPGGDTSVDQDGDGYRDGIVQQTLDRNAPGSFCYCFFQGTSMAAPHVSAVAALVVSRGVASPAAVRAALVASARDLGPSGWDADTGAGLVQALGAVQVADLLRAPGTLRTTESACPPGRVPAAAFGDIGGNVHAGSIACAAWWGLAGGTGPTTYDPAGTVTRGQLASFVARSLEAAGVAMPVAPDAFRDDDGSVHQPRIDQLAALGVVGGLGAGVYGPDAPVTRGQLASFLVRAHGLADAVPLPVRSGFFGDDDGNVHEANIDRAAAAGLAGGTGPSTFAPAAPVSRGQLASFLTRLLDLLVVAGRAPSR